MTLDERILEKLADWRPDSIRQALTLDDEPSGWRVHITADTVEKLGVRLSSLEVRRLRVLESIASLPQQAQQLASNITGLLEPLKVLEIDEERGIAQLRSVHPSRSGEESHYYEILRHADGSTFLHRYRVGIGRREAVEFCLTHEALAKLIRDIVR